MPSPLTAMLIGALIAVPVGGLGVAASMAPSSTEMQAIEADPDTQQGGGSLHAPKAPGIGARRLTISNASTGTPMTPVLPTQPLDAIDPWSGADLAPRWQIEREARPVLAFDRRDPWEPTTVYPAAQKHEPAFIPGDPWASNRAHNGVAKSTAPSRSKHGSVGIAGTSAAANAL